MDANATVPAPANESAPVVSPLAAPITRAMLDNGLSVEACLEWVSLASARAKVRSEAWWLGQE
jgi:hypothetical protein